MALDKFAFYYSAVEQGRKRPFQLMHELKMTRTTFYRYIHELKQIGMFSVEQFYFLKYIFNSLSVVDKTRRICYTNFMDKKYYTVAEFAKKVGISPQAVYKQVNKRLKNHCKLVEGRKVISENAFSLFPSETVEPNVDIDTQLVANLWNQIREKDRQIETMGNQLNEKDLQIARRDEQISELTKAFREAQALHAGTLQRELSDNSTGNNKHRWWQFWHQKD